MRTYSFYLYLRPIVHWEGGFHSNFGTKPFFYHQNQQKMFKIIQQSDYKVNKWSGGITRELFILPHDSSLAERNFNLRISSAVIHLTESTFSDFSHYQRFLLPVEGNITLYIDGRAHQLSNALPFAFDGSKSVRSANSSGAIDFNVICRKDYKTKVTVVHKGESKKNTKTFIFALEDIDINGRKVEKYNSVLTSEPYKFTGKAVVVEIP